MAASPDDSPLGKSRFPALPHSAEELSRALRRPDRLVDVILGAPRLAADVADSERRPQLLAVLLLAASLGTVPFAAILGLAQWWKLAVLGLGSTLICWPSLHVFATFAGFAVPPLQNLALALTIPAVGAAFTAGFAPVLAFLRATMGTDGGSPEAIPWTALATVLLGVALAAGALQAWRCAARDRATSSVRFVLLLGAWHLLFVHVLWRMHGCLGLAAATASGAGGGR